MNFEVGQNIHAIYKRGKYETFGTIIKIVEPRTPLSELEMKEYAQLEKGHQAYKSVEGANCSVKRLILETAKGYTIVPVNFNSWEIAIDGGEPKEENRKMICVDYGKAEKEFMAANDVFKNFDAYKIVADRHGLDRNTVKRGSFMGFYMQSRPVGRREAEAKRNVILAQIEDALEAQGII